MSEPVKERTGKPFRAKDFGPILEGQICGDHEAVIFIGPADDLEEKLRPRLGEGHISEFINHQQMKFLELFVQSLKPFFLPALHELSHKVGGGMEANVSALGASGKRQGADQMGFAGSRVPDEEHVLFFVQILPSQKLPDQRFICTIGQNLSSKDFRKEALILVGDFESGGAHLFGVVPKGKSGAFESKGRKKFGRNIQFKFSNSPWGWPWFRCNFFPLRFQRRLQ